MKLRRLAVRRLPGIAGPGFEIDRFGDGVNVVVGPNASGKTSLLRAVRAALHADELAGESVHVEAAFAAGESTFTAVRTGGTLDWTHDGRPAEAPPLPEHRFVSCHTLHLEDLLAGDARADAEIARRIAREVAGGYDFEAARKSCGFSVPAQLGRREARELGDAESRLRKLQHERRDLRREEERIEGLDRDRCEAEAAGREAVLVDRARQLLERRRERVDLERRRAAFPPDLDRLTGGEAGRLEALREERQDAAAHLERAEAERRAAERALAETGLAGSGLEEGSIEEMRARAGRLRRLEGDVERERTAGREAAAARGWAAQELGGAPGERVRLDPETIHAAERALDASRRLAAELRALEAEAARLPEPEPPGIRLDPNRDPDRLREARGTLLRWLSAVSPSGGRGGGAAGRLAALAVLAAAAAVGGAAAGLLIHPAGFGLLAVAAAAAGWLLLRRDPGKAQRQEAEQRYRALGVSLPERWTADRVRMCLDGVDAALDAARRHAGEARRREEVERTRDRLRADFEAERARLAELARRTNFDPEALDGSFDRWLRLTDQYDRADVALRESEARLAALEREADAVRTAVAVFLTEHGEPPGGPGTEAKADGGEALGREAPGGGTPEDEAPGGGESGSGAADAGSLGVPPVEAEVIGRRLDRLAERVRRRGEARRAIALAEEHRERLAADVGSRDAAMEALYLGAGVDSGDEVELRRRLGLLEAWRVLGRRLAEARGAEALLGGELRELPGLLAEVEADDDAALLRRTEELREKSGRAQALADEITRVRTLVEQASRGRDLEHARAARQRAEDALRARYDDSLLADAGAFLLDRIEEEHVNSSRPAVLRRAEDWFARFTRHRFALEVAAAGNGRDSGAFRARETETGERRALSELSSSTRMQLLLAVRVAFAIEVERGRTPLPFFLDEALTTADPERYRAAVESLRRLSEEDGRQILYLTAQPDEAAYWAAARPNVIDLAEWQRTGRAAAYPSELELPPAPPEPPHPGDRTPEEYAVVIGASPVDPWASPAGIHLFHVLRDDLDLLRRLLRAEIDRLGPLASLLDSDEAGLLLSDAEGSELRRRAAGVEAWVEAWREGRGRPVDREALEASGAVSERFLPDVSALAERLTGDARALLHALDEGAVPRFRARRHRQLEDWLAGRGHLPDTGPLDRPALGRRVAATLSAYGASPDTVLDEAARLVRAMAAGLPNQGGGAAGADVRASEGRGQED